ncbi:hypothetical protein ABZV58_29005 [Nocardia sp. NPDC004654]|uniref:hypothetical protein n=1 Tax=Nocardia sp. NPDC004654 TaxID=3154776 RepID=UPI0033B3BDCE
MEHATHVMLTMWSTYLDPATIGDRQLEGLIGAATGLRRSIARAIDDEVTWYLGNRPEVVTLADDNDEIVTVGDLIGRITMLVVFLDQWPLEQGQCPVAPAFTAFGRQYESLITDLVAGKRRQPRRRRDGAPPIPQPQRIELASVRRRGRRKR